MSEGKQEVESKNVYYLSTRRKEKSLPNSGKREKVFQGLERGSKTKNFIDLKGPHRRKKGRCRLQKEFVGGKKTSRGLGGTLGQLLHREKRKYPIGGRKGEVGVVQDQKTAGETGNSEKKLSEVQIEQGKVKSHTTVSPQRKIYGREIKIGGKRDSSRGKVDFTRKKKSETTGQPRGEKRCSRTSKGKP